MLTRACHAHLVAECVQFMTNVDPETWASCFANKYLFLLNKNASLTFASKHFLLVFVSDLGGHGVLTLLALPWANSLLPRLAIMVCPYVQRPGCVQVIAPPRSARLWKAVSMAQEMEGRLGRRSLLLERCRRHKKTSIEDRRVENWCQSSHHPAVTVNRALRNALCSPHHQ